MQKHSVWASSSFAALSHVSSVIGRFRTCNFFSPGVIKINNQSMTSAGSNLLMRIQNFGHMYTYKYLLPIINQNSNYFSTHESCKKGSFTSRISFQCRKYQHAENSVQRIWNTFRHFFQMFLGPSDKDVYCVKINVWMSTSGRSGWSFCSVAFKWIQICYITMGFGVNNLLTKSPLPTPPCSELICIWQVFSYVLFVKPKPFGKNAEPTAGYSDKDVLIQRPDVC